MTRSLTDLFCRNPRDDVIRIDVSRDDGASADNGSLTNFEIGQNGRVRPYASKITDLDAACNSCAAHYMHASTDDALMIDRAVSVQDRIFADLAEFVNNNEWHNMTSHTNLRRWFYESPFMN
ncbi:hypothetical protein AXW83_22535 [Bosea sp. PAMC 26642]|nr:hypothetical protein AXW83_22535 [Bosea sp. PAMC 26642]